MEKINHWDSELSIIVPIYNVEKYLRECVDSILNQTFTDFELILVDDGSPDGCPQICDAYAEQDNRVRVIHQKNDGLSAARNAGIEAARGNWLSFIDSDDFIAPDFLGKLYTAVKNANADCAICGIQLAKEDGKPLTTPDNMNVQEGVWTGIDILNTMKKRANTPYLVAWNKIYRRELFQDIRYPVGRLNEDNFIFAELFHTARTVVCIAEPLYYYRQREGSIMRSQYTVRNLDAMWGFVDCYKYFQAYGMEELLVPTEKRIFAKLTGTYHQLPLKDRRAEGTEEARRVQWEIARDLKRQNMLSKKFWSRILFFQRMPNVYSLYMSLKLIK